jgi:hypothetical protein
MQRGSEQRVRDTSASLAREIRERTQRWSEQQMADANVSQQQNEDWLIHNWHENRQRATLGRELQRERMQRGTKRQKVDTSVSQQSDDCLVDIEY